MVPRDSILRRLPSELNRKQALLFDGVRHAAEIVGFAYQRLQRTLTTVATEDHEPAAADELYTAAFVDAWAVVDAIDRFRALWQLVVPSSEAPPGHRSFGDIAQPVRDLRNVADHLAQRADYVVAHKGAALGILQWLTVVSENPPEVFSCTIVPGTMQSTTTRLLNPMGKEVELPTGLITLAAGEHVACLSEVIPELERRLRSLEQGLSQEIAKLGLSASQAGADLFLKVTISTVEPPPTVPTGDA